MMTGHTPIADLMERFGLPARPHDKPRVAVSACLLGRPVRYDGDHKHEPLVTGELGGWFDYVPLCPETGIGMPVPRPPIQVVEVNGEKRARRVDPPHEDMTPALQQFALTIDGQIDGIILKARSPSCGVGSTPVYEENEETGRYTDGIFAQALAQRFPALARRDEQALMDPAVRHAFVLQCHLYHRWRGGRTDAAMLARWQALCVEQGEKPFLQLAERLQHWRGMA